MILAVSLKHVQDPRMNRNTEIQPQWVCTRGALLQRL